MTLDNLNTQKIELHANYEDISEIKLPISEIKLPSLLPSAKHSHLITWTLLVLNIFLFDPNNHLASYQILSYQELNVVAPMSSLAMHKFLYFFSWLAILLIIILKSTPSQDFQHKIGNQWDFCTVEWAKSHHIFAP